MKEMEIVERFLHTCRRLAMETQSSYRHTLRYLVEWADGRSLFELNSDDLDRFLYERPRKWGEGQRAASTIRREHTTLKKFYTWVALTRKAELPEDFLEELATKDAWKPQKVNIRTPKPVDDDHWHTLWTADLTLEREPYTGHWDRVWLGLGYFLGFRKIEFILAETANIDLDAGTATIFRKGNVWDVVPITEMADEMRPHRNGRFVDDWLELLDKQVAERDGETFLSPLTRARRVRRNGVEVWEPSSSYVRTYYKKHMDYLLRRAELPPGSMTPHRLRHSAITTLYRRGVLMEHIAELANHTSMEMTRRYAEVSRDFTEERVRNMRARGLTDAELVKQ
jgi:site-specific recombinase XerD